MRSSNEEPPLKRSRLSFSEAPAACTPSTKVAEATSAGSRADYTCYTIRCSCSSDRNKVGPEQPGRISSGISTFFT